MRTTTPEPGSVQSCRDKILALFLLTGEIVPAGLLFKRAADAGLGLTDYQINRTLYLLVESGDLSVHRTPRTRVRCWSNVPADLEALRSRRQEICSPSVSR